MREILKGAGVIVSIVLAAVAFVYGWRAASAWAKASEVEIKHHFGMESPDTDWAHEAKISAMMDFSESADLNRKAVDLTK